jgi:FKBP-type peptidyl-prolyl cis-trans isomerase (trigger factor)
MKIKTNVEKLPKGTYKIVATIPWSEIEKAKEKALDELSKDTEVKGFRKGKAPLKVVREHLGEQKLLEHSTKFFLTDAYLQIIKENNIKPFIDPNVTLVKAPVGGDWEIRYELAEAPEIKKLADYNSISKSVAKDLKKDEIWVPGKDESKKTETEKEKTDLKNKKLQRIFDETISKTEIEISPLIIDLEVGRRLTTLYEEIKQLGLTVEQYLQSKKETKESLKAKIEKEIIDIYKSELILDKIADNEKIVVDKKELEKIFNTAKTDKEKEQFEKNSYFYSRLIRKQKTLDYLASVQ